MRDRKVLAGLTLIFLLAASAYTGRPLAIHLFQLLTFSFCMALLAITDRYYCLWRDTRYLGHYRLLKQLGQGGMGVVYQARNIVSRQTVALKTLHSEVLEDEKNKMRFFREAAILKQMDHPNIVRIYESGEAGGRGYISMELLRGATLKSIIRKSGPLCVETALEVMSGVVRALTYMHELEILHRDLKSENIFIVEPKRGSVTPVSTRPPFVKLLDFGLSRDHQMKTMTRAKELMGTLAYMAPEQFQGHPGDHRSDIYALGVVFYESLTGCLPYEAENDLRLMEKIRNGETIPIKHYLPELSDEVIWIINKAIAPCAEDRFDSVQTLNNVIDTVLETMAGRTSSGVAAADMAPEIGPILTAGPEARFPEPLSDNSKMGYLQRWEEDFARVKILYEKGSYTEAQSLMLGCMGAIEKIVAGMDEEEWAAFCIQPEVVAFYEWLKKFASD